MIHSLLMRYLDRRNVEVHVACDPGTRDKPSASYHTIKNIPGIQVRPTLFGPSVNYRSKRDIASDALTRGIPSALSLFGLAMYIRKHHIQIIHGTEKPRDAFIGFLLSRLTGAKCVIHVHVKAENWISPTVQWAMRHADALIGVSDFVAHSLVDFGCPAEKVYPILNSIETDGWCPEADGSAIRKEFRISPDSPLLSIISRIFYWKGHAELIKALALVKTKAPKVKLMIVGEDDPRGKPGNGSYTSELKALVKQLDLEEQVIFTGYRRDIPQIMAAMDIYTMPSFEEPCGVVYLEAMAMKKPVIALDNGGAREVIENGKSGLLSLPQDIHQLSENICTLIEDPSLRVKMGEFGRCRVESYFNPSRMARDVEQVYHHILNR